MKSRAQRRADFDQAFTAAKALPTMEERVAAAENLRRKYGDVLGRPCQQNRSKRVAQLLGGKS